MAKNKKICWSKKKVKEYIEFESIYIKVKNKRGGQLMAPTLFFIVERKVKMKVTQLCPTLHNPMDYTVCGIF